MNNTELQTESQAPSDQPNTPPKAKAKRGRKKILIGALLGIILLCAAAGVAIYVMRQGNPAVALLESIENTVKLEQIKFTATVVPVPQSDSDSMEDLKAEGVYKKGAGLSATATSTNATDLIETTRHSRWVLDASGNVYSNLQLIDSKVVKSDPSITQEIIDKMALAMKTNTNKNKDVWVKMTTKDVEYDNVYGVRSCMLGAFYKIQSQPESIQEFAQQTVQSGYATVKWSGDVYQIVPNTERHDALGGAIYE